MDTKALGLRVKQAREQNAMTQEDLAFAVGYSVDHVSVIERGIKAARLDKLIEIANVLHVGLDFLCGENLDVSNQIRSSFVSDKIQGLSPQNQRKVLRLLDSLITEFSVE